MNSQQRTKGFASLFICLSLAACAGTPLSALAQQKSRTTRERGTTSSPVSQTEAKAPAARRAEAISLLVETANDARAFKDLQYRARLQMMAADALWPVDEARARQIFRRAWEAATEADREEERAAAEEAGIFSNAENGTLSASRDEVLSKAAARDAKLAETFLRELVEERERAAESAKSNEQQQQRRAPWRDLSPLGARRLALGYELLNRLEYARAVSLVEPLLLEGISGDLLEFILRLRALSAGDAVSGQADRLYLLLLAKARASGDANDLLLLSSYVVSPQLMMVVDETGGLQYRSLPPARLNQNLLEGPAARYFFGLAATMLAQRAGASQRPVNPLQDRIARYVVTGRLIPFFEQAGPEYAQAVASMRSQLAVLSGEMEAARRSALDSQFELVSLNRKNATDPLAPQLEQLKRAGDQWERDRISLGIVRKAARERLWDRAQRSAYAIEDAGLRRAALAFIVVNQIADISRAYRQDKEDDFESVARFVRRAEAPHFASAWGLGQAAVIAARKRDGREAVSALLSEAESYAARADKDTRQRAAAYIVITDAAARVDPARAWAFLAEVVRAANSTPDYMGDETTLPTSADLPEDSALRDELVIEADAFRLDAVFATMARIDFDKTLTQARALTAEVPRAYARIATARAALERL